MTPILDLLTQFVVVLALMGVCLTSMIMVSWLASLCASKMVLPTVQCREASNSLAVKAAVNGISACAPEGSNISVTLSACASENTIWLAFINQIKVAFCYLLGLSTDTQADILAIQDDITAIDAEIVDIQAQLPTVHTGTPTLSAGANAGASPTLSLITGSDDIQGMVQVTLGVGATAAGGTMCTLTFGNPFNAPIFPIVTVRHKSGGLIGEFFGSITTAPVASVNLVVVSPDASLVATNTLQIAYRIGYTS